MGFFDKSIDPQAKLNPAKLNDCRLITYPGPVVGQTAGATPALLALTSITSLPLNPTAGQWTALIPNGVNPRNLRLYTYGTDASYVTATNFQIVYKGPNGGPSITRTVAGRGYTAGTTGATYLDFDYNVGRIVSASISALGPTLTGAKVGIGIGGKLGIPNRPGTQAAILAEHGQSAVPSLSADGLFTPGTTMDGTANISIRYFGGNASAV